MVRYIGLTSAIGVRFRNAASRSRPPPSAASSATMNTPVMSSRLRMATMAPLTAQVNVAP